LRSCACALSDHDEVVVGDRVFVLLPQKLSVDERLDGGWKRVGKFALKESDRPRVLFGAKEKLRFLFTLDGLFPHRHRDGHHHGHHRQADNERRHRVSSFGAPSIDFALTR
jgi:hypothetical protein